MNQTGVVTVGSINIDLVVYAQRRPQPGETFAGEKFTISAGGKGANQAIQAALSGASSFMVARIGKDVFAPLVLEAFDRAGVNRDYVFGDDAGTGIGHVTVDAHGDYSSIIVARANGNLSPEDIDLAEPAFARSNILLLQLEVPMKSIVYAARKARNMGLMVFLNAAPALPLSGNLLGILDVLIVNEIEAQMITGIEVGADLEDCYPALSSLAASVPNVVMSLGARGALAINVAGEKQYVPGHNVKVANTIGAGDAFIGELAARMAQGFPLLEAVPYANAAGALAVMVPASQGIQPNRDCIEALLADKSATWS